MSGWQTKLSLSLIISFENSFQQYSTHLEPSQTSKIELLVKIVNYSQPLTISTKAFILDVPLRSECPSVLTYVLILQLYCSEHWKDLALRINC